MNPAARTDRIQLPDFELQTPPDDLDMRPYAFFKAVPRPINYALQSFKAFDNGSPLPGRRYKAYTPPFGRSTIGRANAAIGEPEWPVAWEPR